MGERGPGDNILRLRRKKGVTQEVLAEFIGVTKTSVSKWETGTTMPDIQMLPLLASYFEVSVDELIGYVPMLGREQIRAHYQRLARAFAEEPFGEVLDQCGEMIRKYYSCYPFLQQMVVLLLNHVAAADTQAGREEALKMSAELCDHILGDCQEVAICKNVASLRGMLNLMQGRPELVAEAFGEEGLCGERMNDEGTLLVMAYLMMGEREKAGLAAQIGMYRSLMCLLDYGTFLLEAEKEPGFGRILLERLDGVMALFEMQGLSPNAMGKYEYQAAVSLAGKLAAEPEEGQETAGPQTRQGPGERGERDRPAQGQTDTGADPQEIEAEVFRHLEKYVLAGRQLFEDGIRLHGDGFFYRLNQWFEELELGTAAVRSDVSVKESILQGFKNPVFGALRDQDRLRRLQEQCEKELKGRSGEKCLRLQN